MGYWTDAAESEGSQAVKMPNGFNRAKAIKVVMGPKDKPAFTSKHGDPQVMVVFANSNNEEAACMFTLSDKARWVMAKFLQASGANLQAMEQGGITIDRFSDYKFAEKQLVGRECWLNVEWETGDNGKEYSKISFWKEADIPVQYLQKAKNTPEASDDPGLQDDIPF